MMNRLFYIVLIAVIFSACENQAKDDAVRENKDVKIVEIEGGMTAFDSLNKQIKVNPNNALLLNKRAKMFLL
ncbi:MAG: hypothetical protein KAH25_10675, partial [Bacteroidales bacterium]|nr:hypothetical protein [Bacteroidales bacterium]